MALGVSQATERPLATATTDVWRVIVALLHKCRRRRTHLPRTPLSEAWLREHAIESSKHHDPLYG
jgi:hypothetical protein